MLSRKRPMMSDGDSTSKTRGRWQYFYYMIGAPLSAAVYYITNWSVFLLALGVTTRLYLHAVNFHKSVAHRTLFHVIHIIARTVSVAKRWLRWLVASCPQLLDYSCHESTTAPTSRMHIMRPRFRTVIHALFLPQDLHCHVRLRSPQLADTKGQKFVAVKSRDGRKE